MPAGVDLGRTINIVEPWRHSCRRTSFGSTRNTRRTGAAHAMSAASPKMPHMPPTVAASVGSMLNRNARSGSAAAASRRSRSAVLPATPTNREPRLAAVARDAHVDRILRRHTMLHERLVHDDDRIAALAIARESCGRAATGCRASRSSPLRPGGASTLAALRRAAASPPRSDTGSSRRGCRTRSSSDRAGSSSRRPAVTTPGSADTCRSMSRAAAR